MNKPVLIKNRVASDDRGHFRKFLDSKKLLEEIDFGTVTDINFVTSFKKFTFRGFHYQEEPFGENKYISVISGKILDLAINLKSEESGYLDIYDFQLSDEDDASIIIPKGFAHGYLTLEPNTSVIYATSNFYSPSHERGIRWDDPKIDWRFPHPKAISKKDLDWAFR
jgi:dTDP-4-dehydrorhamnose 3,5-epimerase